MKTIAEQVTSMLYPTNAIKLNLGCGTRYNTTDSWVNVDFAACPPFVQKADLRKGLPFTDDLFEFIYTSHVLDHFDIITAELIVKEAFRCLRPHGIFRVVVPDLEFNCRRYLKSIEDNAFNPERHHWFMIELLDQMTRTQPGGEKAKFLRAVRDSKDPALQQWLRPLLGPEMISHLEAVKQPANSLISLKQRIKRLLKLNSFSRSGERHYWTYDWISLSTMFKKVGFTKPTRQNYDTSLYKVFNAEKLDEHNTQEYKPGSLYIEGVKE